MRHLLFITEWGYSVPADYVPGFSYIFHYKVQKTRDTFHTANPRIDRSLAHFCLSGLFRIVAFYGNFIFKITYVSCLIMTVFILLLRILQLFLEYFTKHRVSRSYDGMGDTRDLDGNPLTSRATRTLCKTDISKAKPQRLPSRLCIPF